MNDDEITISHQTIKPQAIIHKNRSQRQISELTKLYSKMCIFSCFVFKSDEYSVAYENLQSNTDAYKLVAYKKKRV